MYALWISVSRVTAPRVGRDCVIVCDVIVQRDARPSQVLVATRTPRQTEDRVSIRALPSTCQMTRAPSAPRRCSNVTRVASNRSAGAFAHTEALCSFGVLDCFVLNQAAASCLLRLLLKMSIASNLEAGLNDLVQLNLHKCFQNKITCRAVPSQRLHLASYM